MILLGTDYLLPCSLTKLVSEKMVDGIQKHQLL